MAIVDARLNYLSAEKQKLLRMLDQKQVGDEEFNNRMKIIEDDIEKIQDEMLHPEEQEEVSSEVVEDEIVTVTQPIKNKKTKIRGRKQDDNSFSHIGFIILESGRPHSMEESVLIYEEVSPGKTKKQYTQSLANVICRVKRGEKRYADYIWDESAWQMLKKE
jgi:hypothetical protein